MSRVLGKYGYGKQVAHYVKITATPFARRPKEENPARRRDGANID